MRKMTSLCSSVLGFIGSAGFVCFITGIIRAESKGELNAMVIGGFSVLAGSYIMLIVTHLVFEEQQQINGRLKD